MSRNCLYFALTLSILTGYGILSPKYHFSLKLKSHWSAVLQYFLKIFLYTISSHLLELFQRKDDTSELISKVNFYLILFYFYLIFFSLLLLLFWHIFLRKFHTIQLFKNFSHHTKNLLDYFLISWPILLYQICCLLAKSCLTLCNPMNSSPPDSSVHGISQARILEWIAISFSSWSPQPRDRIHVFCISCIAGRFFTIEPSGNPFYQALVILLMWSFLKYLWEYGLELF